MGKIITGFLLLASMATNASLITRGSGLIYDDVLDITWLQDANYAATSGYTATNATPLPTGSSSHGIYANGGMGWGAATDWVGQQICADAKGITYDDWRLPSVEDNPTEGFHANGEIGYMFYTNLGNTGRTFDELGNVVDLGFLTSSSFIDGESGETVNFNNIQIFNYWYGEQNTLYSQPSAWAFGTDNGHQSSGCSLNCGYFSWAVRDGDVSSASIPESSTISLMGLGLLALLCRANRGNRLSKDDLPASARTGSAEQDNV